MKLVFIIGDMAVGKMTVGQELAKLTGLRLFHNHMSIEFVIEVFGSYNGKAINRIREVVFEEFAAGDAPGMIFTYVWAFDQQHDWDYVAHVKELFERHGAEVCFVELIAPQAVRLARNATENRLAHKPSKRDIAVSNERLLKGDEKYRLISQPGEIPYENYLRIENADISAEAAARMIKERFGL